MPLGREQGFSAIGWWCQSKRVLWQPGPFLVDFLPGRGINSSQLIRSNSNNRSILSVKVDEIIVKFSSNMGPDEREAGDGR